MKHGTIQFCILNFAFFIPSLFLAGCGSPDRPAQPKGGAKPDDTKAGAADPSGQQPPSGAGLRVPPTGRPDTPVGPAPAAAASPQKRKPAAGKAVPAPVPDWALGAIYFREFGNGLAKAGAYANKLLPNSAELAKQMVTSYLLDLPADAGLKPDGPAAIFALDPISTGTKNERAFIMPVADAATLKTALINTYGVPTEEGGVMTFVLPQPMPQPDKMLLLKLLPGRLLGAPSTVVLRRLDEYAAGNPFPFGNTPLPVDVLVVARVAGLKRMYGDALALSLDVSAQKVAQHEAQAEKLKAWIKNVLDTLWQLDAIEAQLELDGPHAALELRVMPASRTELARLFAVPATPTSGKVLSLLPDNAAVAASWNMNRGQGIAWLRAELEKQGTPGTLGTELLRTLLDVLQLAGDEGALTVSGDAANGSALTLALRSHEARKAAQGLSASLETVRAVYARGSGAIHIEDTPAVEHGGVAIRGLRASPTGGAPLPPSPGGAAGAPARQPVSLQYAAADDTLLLAVARPSGSSRDPEDRATASPGLAALKQALDRAKQPAPPANKKDDDDEPLALPDDAVAVLAVYPVRLTMLALRATPVAGLDPAKLSIGLPDDAAMLSLRQTENLVALRLELPASVPQAGYTLMRRIEKANALRRAQAPPEAGVPAPPPP